MLFFVQQMFTFRKNVITDLSDRFNHYCSHCRKKCFLRSYVCRAVPNQIKVHLKVQTLAALRPLGADLASFEATKLLRCVELFEVPAIEFGLFSALQNSDAVRNFCHLGTTFRAHSFKYAISLTRNGFGTGANFQSQNIPESFRGVLLCFPFCKRAKSGLKQIFSCGELEKLTVAGFLPFSEMLNS